MTDPFPAQFSKSGQSQAGSKLLEQQSRLGHLHHRWVEVRMSIRKPQTWHNRRLNIESNHLHHQTPASKGTKRCKKDPGAASYRTLASQREGYCTTLPHQELSRQASF